MNDLQPIRDQSVLLSKKHRLLVVADIHLGIENEFYNHGISIEPQSNKIIKNITSLIEKYKPKEIILLGDVKHSIPSTPRRERLEVKKLVETIKSYDCVIHILPGNHDGGLKEMIPGCVYIQPSDGFVYDNIGFIHGHRWPSRELIECKMLITAHTHPMIMLHDRLGYTLFEPCWLHGYLIKDEIKKHYDTDIKKKAEITIMPAFNRLCGGTAVNKDGIIGPLGNIIDIMNLQVFLLDGSYLGLVKDIR
ncbi:MAG: metallophosphoesterase [Candidatus Thermoplasmatota archaeon]